MKMLNDHRQLFGAALGLFLVLSFLVAILPALNNQKNNAPLPGTVPLSGDALRGKEIFIANGCVACHTQQVRNVAMDRVWGARPNIAADYAGNQRLHWWMNTATLMGTERTGPDLTNIGARLPAADWHLLHLYNPRAVVEASIMPAYPWLFEHKEKPAPDDKLVRVPEEFIKSPGTSVVATREAMQLVAYLQSLRQADLPDGSSPRFINQRKNANTVEGPGEKEPAALDGAMLYANNCQACHQANGEGLPGAFPALKGSKIVLDKDPQILIEIILKGYNAREEYGEMPAIGTLNDLNPAEIAAIINHERSSWGNDAGAVSAEEVEKIVALINQETSTPLP
jgi:cytochrome c oxidase cbb3-type subunit 2